MIQASTNESRQLQLSYEGILLLPIMDALTMIVGTPGRVLFVDARVFRAKRRRLLHCLVLTGPQRHGVGVEVGIFDGTGAAVGVA